MATLFLDCNRRFVNNTNTVIHEILMHKYSDLYFYGPGFVSSSTLKNGIQEFVKSKNITTVITTEYIYFSNFSKPYEKHSVKDNIRSFSHSFPIDLYSKAIFDDLWNYFKNFSGKKYLFMLQTDYYNFRKEYTKQLKKDDYLNIIGFGEDLISSVSILPRLDFEKFADQANDNWLEFCQENKLKIHSTPHILSPSELNFKDFRLKEARISIPGVPYWFRSQVRNVLKLNRTLKLKVSKGFVSRFLRILNRFGLNIYGSEIGLMLYQNNFLQDIRNSRYVVTCGSQLKWPLRKFFEIPAQGSLLICQPFKNAEKYGFQDGVNCIFINEPSEIIQKLEFLESNLDIAEAIAFNGYEMIRQRHCTHSKKELFDD